MGPRPAHEAGLHDDMRDEAAAGQVLSEKVQDVPDGHPTAGTEAAPVGGVPSPCGSVPTVVDKWDLTLLLVANPPRGHRDSFHGSGPFRRAVRDDPDGGGRGGPGR